MRSRRSHPDEPLPGPARSSWTRMLPGEGDPGIERYNGLPGSFHRAGATGSTPSSPRPSKRAASEPGSHLGLAAATRASRSSTSPTSPGAPTTGTRATIRSRDPGQHRPADPHRPRGRSGLPRGLPRPPRLQRAARAAPRARARLGRVLDLPALQPAVADRRGDGQLRDPGRLPGRRAHRLRARARSFRWRVSTRPEAERLLRGPGAGRAV